MKKHLLSILTFFLATTSWCNAMQIFSNPDALTAPLFFGETRFEKKGLTSLDLVVRRGATRTSRNSCSDKTCLLSVYGAENMLYLGEGVPGKDPNNPADFALINLGNLPARDQFAQLAFSGTLNVVDIIFLATQNIAHGFFVQLHIPVRKLEIDCIGRKDLSPCDQICPNINSQTWTTFLYEFNDILQKYGLSLGPINKIGLGDVSAYLGWTKNYQKTNTLDYIDTTIKLGVITPTSHLRNENEVFDIPLGYNGHSGVSGNADLSIGAYEWLTIGGHLRALIFAHAQHLMRMKTDAQQNGFIKLAAGKASVSPGAILEAGTYVKADHLIRGLSLLIGYSYTRKSQDSLTACNNELFPACIINSDTMLQPWHMHTIHYVFEYDFTKKTRLIGPRISLYFDQQVGGKRVFDTDMPGAGFGIDIGW